MASSVTVTRGSVHLRHTKEIDAKLEALRSMLTEHDRRCWEIGDIVVELVDYHRMQLATIAKTVGYSKSRLSEFHLTARTFGPEERGEGSFYDGLMARRIWKAMPRLGMSSLTVRRHIVGLPGKRPRQIKAHFVSLLIRRERQRSATRLGDSQPQDHGLINAAHHADWRDIIPRLADGSVKVVFADPPFGGYSWRPEGGYLSGRADTNGLRCESDNNSDEEAMAVTLPLFELCLSKLAPGGCLLLFQAGGKPDRAEVLDAAHHHGWDCLYGLTWQKDTLTPSDCAYPYVPSSERILVFVRAGDRLEWHEPGLSRSDVLSFKSPTPYLTKKMLRGDESLRSFHMFQKPDDLCEFIVRKHTHPGELAVEPFGCSGAFSMAAARLKRQWVYIESNDDNFRWGSVRLSGI